MQAENKIAIYLFGTVALAIIVLFISANQNEVEWRKEKAETKPPQRLAELVINEPKAAVRVAFKNGTYQITYSIDQWFMDNKTARNVSFDKAIALTEAVFKKFADAKSIKATTATYRDKKGRESASAFNWVEFSRKNAANIKLSIINHSDIPDVADGYWEHPSVSR